MDWAKSVIENKMFVRNFFGNISAKVFIGYKKDIFIRQFPYDLQGVCGCDAYVRVTF